ncbi:glycosyltransferase family 4 protein [Aquibacillus salsiterrae]|uniref:Undecaprenyl/decaprenyl-phosphate alpha-N-acetylglucosaminyl 1-phosphate transferase n=1 Tax=Aquibacillus salsiterrae TaxID=2950439 RepID=A0A9X3WBP1_9BACI|nr:MraY family glycosyltransferase [Aquibacillus salsiterrae]MDC3416702.1 undecaprenyl/decaprenyl-phosphate alpha-N-acetylglucosaminyl 1-phosphate transferase [Aquibacillus salsiterrae]
MFEIDELVIAFIISLVATWILTPQVKKLAVLIGAMDVPDHRKIHTVVTPRLGGLAIYLGVIAGFIYLQPTFTYFWPIMIGTFVIIITGILDDIFQLKPVYKLAGQVIASGILIYSGLLIEKITIPIIGIVPLESFSILITFLWIIGITNAINLIDGLDGLASGVTTIALTSIAVMAFVDVRVAVFMYCIVLIGSNFGFLYHNFHPAKIYMGDTGSMFLGYSVAVISILGLFKNVTLFSFIIPIIVLAVPIFDTLFAIVRRAFKGENIMMPDKFHIHYQLLAAGFSHRMTVLIIYAFSTVFGVLAILFSNATLSASLIITLIVLVLLHIFAEIVGAVNGKKPVLRMLRKTLNKVNK